MDLTQKEWKEKLQANASAMVIDVRTPEEWEEGIIPGARMQNIHDAHGFMDMLGELNKQGEYFLLCRSGGRSGQATMIMKSQGFQKVYNLLGGMTEWEGETVIPDLD